MCQLLGFCAEKPVSFARVFREFRKGAASNPHAWGIALWRGDGRGPLVVREPRSAGESPLAALLAANPVPGTVLVAHIRYGTTGGRDSLTTVTNAHPFVARVGDRDWAFAHNGSVPGLAGTVWHQPHGTTDSERAFSFLVGELLHAGPAAGGGGFGAVARAAREAARRGKFNFLLSDGKTLYFFSNRAGTLYYREARCGGRVPAVVVATRPLGGARWRPCEPGVLYAAASGAVVAAEAVELLAGQGAAQRGERPTDSSYRKSYVCWGVGWRAGLQAPVQAH
ncbi:class II glutamine amidotransferase [Desulfovirgula thermocuniculi]|uniref:class II glutamine amidotransferase n=1 Tax=Desulfovirgula thermocuniculi TaxID=348842 RepID=UPI0004017EF8|nr:class II glutamine amidotransferase [Desulfovirgula thermocuniculi]